MRPNKARIRKWVKALRSGKFEQGNSRLYNGIRYCCLGVACEISKIDHWDETLLGYTYLGEDNYLPKQVQEWLGISESNPKVYYGGCYRKLATLNDSDKSFNVIANAIERTYLND